MIDTNDPEFVDAVIQNIYTTLAVYKQREKEYRLFAKADKGHFYTDDKDRFIYKANQYKRLIDELNALRNDIVSDICKIKQKQIT